jgi:hypothetical protein
MSVYEQGLAYPKHPYTYCWDLYNPEPIIQRYPLSFSSMSQNYYMHMCVCVCVC